jgi:glycosyltransferase involved in cell wall biosynthesis
MKTLHFSNSVLSGAVNNLVAALKKIGIPSKLFQTNKIDNIFLKNFLYEAESIHNLKTTFEEVIIKEVKGKVIFHIHNWLPAKYESLISKIAFEESIPVVRHFHQGLGEHPVYYYDKKEDFTDFQVCVSHGFARTYRDIKVLPNISRCQSIKEIKKVQTKLNIIYSPSSNKQTRWGGKENKKFLSSLSNIIKNNDYITNICKNINPDILDKQRYEADITIDELVTGCFHLVSYEGMACGNVVINNADTISLLIFCDSIKAKKFPPFFICNENELIQKINFLNKNRNILDKIKNESKLYFENYLNEIRIAKLYKDFYDEIS